MFQKAATYDWKWPNFQKTNEGLGFQTIDSFKNDRLTRMKVGI